MAATTTWESRMRTRPGVQFLLPVAIVTGAILPTSGLAQSWYLGGGLGQAWFEASPGEVDRGFLIDDAFLASGTTLDKRDTGWKGYAGYRFNRIFALEGGYVDLGNASFDTTVVAAPPGTTPPPPFGIHATAKAQGVVFSALAHWPLSPTFSVFGKAGAFRSKAEFTEVIQATGNTRVHRSERRTDANFGIGLLWMASATVGIRVELERFKNVGRGIGGREGRDVNFASVGLTVHF
jgi:OOP family OmpA-OmpF porin